MSNDEYPVMHAHSHTFAVGNSADGYSAMSVGGTGVNTADLRGRAVAGVDSMGGVSPRRVTIQQRVDNILSKEADMPNVVNPGRRIVKIYVADVDENVPLDKCLLWESEPKMTDLNDQELFMMEVDARSLLEKHNAYRATLTDKSVKDRPQPLEPLRVRDLRMTVVTLVPFG